MADAAWRAVTEVGEGFMADVARRPEATLLAVDFDGTLAPVVANPLDSRLHEGSAAALEILVDRLARIAIITGRAVATVRGLARLDERPALSRIAVLGQYGVERWDLDSGTITRPEAPSGVVAAARELFALLADLAANGWATDGAIVEDKGLAVAVHTRQSADPEGLLEALAGPVAAIAERHRLHLEPGRLVLELRAARHNKGDALRELVDETRPHLVAMIGDDLGDLPALTLLEELRADGLRCCAVVSYSPEQPAVAEVADILCDGPDGVAAWLAELALQIDQRSPMG